MKTVHVTRSYETKEHNLGPKGEILNLGHKESVEWNRIVSGKGNNVCKDHEANKNLWGIEKYSMKLESGLAREKPGEECEAMGSLYEP